MAKTDRSSIQHLTRDELTLARCNVAALTSALSDYATNLERASAALRRYLAEPQGAELNGVLSAEFAVHCWRQKWPNLVTAQICDLARETQKVRELEIRRSVNAGRG